ncbi:MAG: N-acetylglucosamine kinase [Actinomycetes bacterium]
MAELVVGVDGGGTKTDLCLATREGELVALASGGSANWESVGLEQTGTLLGELLDHALAVVGESRHALVGAAACLAGVDWDADVARVDPELNRAGLPAHRLLLNDSFAALRAGLPGTWGCVSVAGTGGVCAGRSPSGEVARSMGVGLGEGSGAWTVVGSAIEAVAAAHHHAGPPTALVDALLSATGTDSVPELFEGLSRGQVHLSGDLATQVMAVAAGGDPVATDLVRGAGERHGRDLAGLADRLGLVGEPTVDVVLAGGIHVHGEGAFRSGFTEAVRTRVPGARFTVLDAPPVVGAVLLALEHVGASGSTTPHELAADLDRLRTP